jgi:hypothetical protein
MLDLYQDLFQNLNFHIYFISTFLFFIGYALAPTAHYKKIKWLTAYPLFILNLMEKHFKFDWAPFKIFIVIFLLNNLSLFLHLLSGWGIIMPFLLAIYLGINIGIVMYQSLQGHFYYSSLLNPVAMLELPAAWLSITLSIQFSIKYFFAVDFIRDVTFSRYLLYFIITVPPLLLVAGIVETFLIVLARRKNL